MSDGRYVDENGLEYFIPPLFDGDGVQASSGIGIDGKEYPDPVPMAPPVGYKNEPTLMEMIRTMVHHEKWQLAQQEAGFESFEEADDFEIEDDPMDPLTEYEKVFYPPPESVPVSAGSGVQGAVAPPPAVQSEVPAAGAASSASTEPPVASPGAGVHSDKHSTS